MREQLAGLEWSRECRARAHLQILAAAPAFSSTGKSPQSSRQPMSAARETAWSLIKSGA